MGIHFENRAKAEAHLRENGWRQLGNGRWISRSIDCAAHILTATGDWVLVQVWEVE